MTLIAALLCASIMACDHGEAWSAAPLAPTPPRTGMPRRLTYNPEGDLWPAWLPDGSGVGYSYHPLERTDRDRCLVFIPPEGGRIMHRFCRRGLHETDSVNAVTTHGVSAGGRVAVVAESGIPRILFPDFRGIWLGRMDDTLLVEARPFPYLTPAGQIHLSASDLVWPNESTLVYLAMYYSYQPPIVDIPADTLYTGIELVRLRLRGNTVLAQSVLAGTGGATSLAAGRGDTVYFTRNGDSRVFSLDTETGAIGTLYDFGPLGIARDVQVAGGRLAAIVGGRVTSYFRATWGIQAQADSGGPIYVVQLPAGTPQLVAAIAAETSPGAATFRHLAMDPTGHRLVAERSEMIERRLREFIDTVMTKRSDLWLFEVP